MDLKFCMNSFMFELHISTWWNILYRGDYAQYFNVTSNLIHRVLLLALYPNLDCTINKGCVILSSSFLSLLSPSLFYPFSFFFPMIWHVRATSLVDFFSLSSLLLPSPLVLFFHVIPCNKSISPIEFLSFFFLFFSPTVGPNIPISSN